LQVDQLAALELAAGAGPSAVQDQNAVFSSLDLYGSLPELGDLGDSKKMICSHAEGWWVCRLMSWRR